jgi:hypothetical protein
MGTLQKVLDTADGDLSNGRRRTCPMQGGYFVSEEAEKAAKWDMREEYKRTKARLVTLENELRKIGDAWTGMGKWFKDPLGISFQANAQQITAVKAKSKITVEAIPLEYLNADAIVRLINDLEETRKSKDDLEARLKDIGGLDLGPFSLGT